MNKKSTLYLLLFVSLLLFIGCLGSSDKNVAAQVKTDSNANTAAQVKTDSNLNVTVEFWQKQRNKALEERTAPTGESPKGLVVPKELSPAGGIVKQKAKMSEMIADGYIQPFDFADLAAKRMSGELVELPIATESYVTEVGGSATEDEFTAYSFEDGSTPLKPDSPKYQTLKKLADDFDGTKYDLNNPSDRKQIRFRLLRMLNPQAIKLLEEIADAYQLKFKRPLRITGMVRSIDYQIQLGMSNANMFKVRGKDSLPPHTSGYAFDIARKTLTAEEQNFIMKKLAETEQQGKTDSLIEYGTGAVFHVFVYADGKPPKT